MKFRVRQSLLFASFVLAFSALAGCSSNLGGDVSGTVTLNGKPVTGGTVVFHYNGKPSVSASIASDGSYFLQKPPRGEAEVSIEPAVVAESSGKIPTGSLPAGTTPDPTKPPPTAVAAAKGEKQVVPEKYKNHKTSGFSVKISGSSQTLDIPMVGEANDKDNKK